MLADWETDDVAAVLCGKVLRRSDNHFERDAAGSIYRECSKALFLHADGTFRYEECTVIRVSAAGMSVPSERRQAAEGRWDVELAGSRPMLVLRRQGRVTARWSTRDGGAGVQYLDGRPWNRYRIR